VAVVRQSRPNVFGDKDLQCTVLKVFILFFKQFIIQRNFVLNLFDCGISLCTEKKGFVFKALLLFDSTLPHLQVKDSMTYKN